MTDRPPESVLVEACVDSVTSAVAAERGGALRLELCDNLADAGTTPSAGMIAAVKDRVTVPVFVIIRPRGGGFLYSDLELDVMRRDIEIARQLGADGIVLGALDAAARVDARVTRSLMDVAPGVPVTFHRAFDLSRDLAQALDTLIALGVSRVLTSGGAPTAMAGAADIATLVDRAVGRIAIMAGGGVREDNAAEVVRRSRVAEVHTRCASIRHATMSPSKATVRFRKALPEDESAWEETDADRIAALVAALKPGSMAPLRRGPAA